MLIFDSIDDFLVCISSSFDFAEPAPELIELVNSSTSSTKSSISSSNSLASDVDRPAFDSVSFMSSIRFSDSFAKSSKSSVRLFKSLVKVFSDAVLVSTVLGIYLISCAMAVRIEIGHRIIMTYANDH